MNLRCLTKCVAFLILLIQCFIKHSQAEGSEYFMSYFSIERARHCTVSHLIGTPKFALGKYIPMYPYLVLFVLISYSFDEN